MSLFTRALWRISRNAGVIRAYVRITFRRLWLFGVSACASALWGVLGWVGFAACGWQPEVGLALAFWPALILSWTLLVAGIRLAAHGGE